MLFNVFLHRLGVALRIVETGLAIVAALCVLAILVTTTADVVMRYAFNAPLGWAFDLVAHYLLVAAFFLGFPLALGRGDHISVDFLARKMPERLTHFMLSPFCLAAAGMIALMAYYASLEAYSAWRAGEVIAGVILWPVWIAKLCVPVALWPMVFRLVQLGLAHGATALDARRFPFRAPAFHVLAD
ncbi:MAG: TRAP transporter small permease [Paracoccaceae bacterium]